MQRLQIKENLLVLIDEGTHESLRISEAINQLSSPVADSKSPCLKCYIQEFPLLLVYFYCLLIQCLAIYHSAMSWRDELTFTFFTNLRGKPLSSKISPPNEEERKTGLFLFPTTLLLVIIILLSCRVRRRFIVFVVDRESHRNWLP